MLQKIVQSFRQKIFLFGSREKFRVLSTRVEPLTFWLIVQILYINPRTYTPIHTPPSGTRGVNGPPPPRVFEMLQYFETILPSVESF